MGDTRSVLLAAAREFNTQRFFEAHEAIEDGLDNVDDAHWDLALGLIQIAVGYHKASQGLWSGALRMLESGLEKTAPFPDEVATLYLGKLRLRVANDIERIRGGKRDEVDLKTNPPRFRFKR